MQKRATMMAAGLPPLLAGRFLPLASRVHLDLATGMPVLVRSEPAGPVDRQRRWVDQAAIVSRLWHPAMACLVDFGVLGRGERFAAFGGERASRITPVGGGEPEWARVDRFLRSHGVVLQPLKAGDVVAWGGVRALVPSWDLEPDGQSGSLSASSNPAVSQDVGLERYRSPLDDVVIRWLDEGDLRGVDVLPIELSPGAGCRTIVQSLARIARLRGFVPIGDVVLDQRAPWLLGATPAHPLFVIHVEPSWREPDRQSLAALVLRLGAEPAARHRVVDLVRQGRPTPGRWAARPVPSDALERLVWLAQPNASARAVVSAVARRSGGWPASFARLLADRLLPQVARTRPALPMVHERPETVYGGPAGPESAYRSNRTRPRPPRARVDALLQHAAHLQARRRGADVHRLLRAGSAACRRRGDVAGAITLACRLAAMLLDEGRLREADALAADAQAVASSDPRPGIPSLVHIHVVRAAVAVHDGRVRDAESLLRTAAAASGALDEADTSGLLALRLADCLWWMHRAEEGLEILRAARVRHPGGHAPSARDERNGPAEVAPVAFDASRPNWLAVEARLLAGVGRVAEATAVANEALALAEAGLQPATLASALLSKALVAAAGADTVAALHCLDRARRAACGRRLRLLRRTASVLLLSMRAREGPRSAPAGRVRRSLERLRQAGLPQLLDWQAALAQARLDPSSGAAPAALVASVQRAGAEALIPGRVGTPAWLPAPAMETPMMRDVIDLVRACQGDDDPRTGLDRAVSVLRDRTRSAAASIEACLTSGLEPLARSGRTLASQLPRRAVDSRRVLGPVATELGAELAVPVLAGPRVVGAIACRWTDAVPVQPATAVALAEAVAAACAPLVLLAVEQACQPRDPDRPAVELVGTSEATARVRHAVLAAARSPFPVLVTGESGVGKELVARAIHRLSPRGLRPLSAVNCAALTDELFEAEVFGHARGAFTGAVADRPGLFEVADGGTLFLDEVADLSARAQAKLLRALQEGEVRRVGETRGRHVDVRVVAATNRSLRDAVTAGAFRHDLMYRLDVVQIVVPPLRERIEDVPPLALRFWREATGRVGSRAILSGGALAALSRYDWPGNVRELENVMAALAVSSPRRGLVGPGALPPAIAGASVVASQTLEQARRQFEQRFVRAALARSGGRRARAARDLGLSRQGLAKILQRLGLDGDPTAISYDDAVRDRP